MSDPTDFPQPLSLYEFAEFYEALYNHRPFQWQTRLAKSVGQGDWPDYLKLPTSSGKTAAIDMAVFALAYQAASANRDQAAMPAPRRIFFVVDRRIIVNEAYRRASRAARWLRKTLHFDTELSKKDQKDFDALNPAHLEVLTRVARWLQVLAGDDLAPPLDCFELRGGIYRDDAWVRSPLQPTVLTSTVDQVGSRLLFRGYGVSNRNLSIHAALTANDSLIILDEAHCSKPFSQTMAAITRYREANWASELVQTPFRFVQMTATPPPNAQANQVFGLDDADYQNDPLLEQRHGCSKPIALVEARGAKGKKLTTSLAKKLVEQAESLVAKHQLRKIAIVVNRVAIAREVAALLEKKHAGRISLMIGRMRPVDRDELTKTLQENFGSGWTKTEQPNPEDVEPNFVVATQCLEVGADLDFDGMVSQAASLDALRQRFGRLNRLGDSPHARGVIVAAEGDIVPVEKLDPLKPIDPIYGNALAQTWHWMNQQATLAQETQDEEVREMDFGVKPLEALCSAQAKDFDWQQLSAPARDAPVLMPAHLDLLCQTSPRPAPDPDVAAYLHGPNHGQPEVRICWRADLDLSTNDWKKSQASWIKAIDLCPPSSAECLSVPLHTFRKWLRGEGVVDPTGDVLGEAIEQEEGKPAKADLDLHRTVLLWRGRRKKGDAEERSFLAHSKNIYQIQPNETIVIPAEFGGWKSFGHIPNAPSDPAQDPDQFPTTKPRELHQLLMKRPATNEEYPALKELARIDIADQAFLQARAKTILRVHPKLHPASELKTLWDDLLKAAHENESDLSSTYWMKEAAILSESATTENSTTNLLDRLREGKPTDANIVRYPNGLVWTTGRHDDLKPGMLPLPSFGDNDDTLSQTEKLPLLQHLSDVYAEARRICETLGLDSRLAKTVLTAAKFHDLGKADPRFQALLIGKPLSVAFMQRQLWAKSAGNHRGRSSELPERFRHEMLSLSLLEHFEYDTTDIDEELLKHAVASHHGYARPLAPVCEDENPPGINLHHLGGNTISATERSQWKPAHNLDSGIAQRFWDRNRHYGWWGLSYLESLLRLADWTASAKPNRGQEALSFKHRTQSNAKPKPASNECVLTGIDGSNPLGYLAALGAFRVLSASLPEAKLQMYWENKNNQGPWRPVICGNKDWPSTNEELVRQLLQELYEDPQTYPPIRLAEAIDKESVRGVFQAASVNASVDQRVDADWLSCNGSDLTGPDVISQLQTTRRDYHAINIRGLLTTTTGEHLRRTLFHAWDYSDPIAGVSLHLEPREDRRHAYQWHVPSGDPTRGNCGGMIGANRLALEAWPLFQSLPAGDRLTTAGFRGTRANNTSFAWPIWTGSFDLATLQSVLGLAQLHSKEDVTQELRVMGIPVVYQCRRILVGKTPNLTSSIAAKM